ncbi:MAG TPA: carbohydrate ABC transporter permease, partial [Chloroflexota bacterium]
GRILVPVLGTIVYTEGILNGNTAAGSTVAVVQVGLAIALAVIGLRLVERERAERTEEEYGWRVSESSLSPRERAGERATLSLTLSHRERGRWRRWLAPALLSLAALVVMVFHLFPVYYTAVQAVRPVNEIAIGNIFWAYHPDFDFLDDILTNPVLARWTANMFIVFGVVLVVGVGAALLAGYAMARLRVRGAGWLARAMFFCYFVPQSAVILPLYQIYNRLNLDNSLPGLILVYFTFTIPFATWLFYAYFQAFDSDVEDHALLDTSRVAVVRRIVLPMSWPVIIAASLFAIGMMGSDVLYSGTFTVTNDVKTLPGGLGITAIDLDEWASVNAIMLMASLPIIAMCAGLSRYFVSGLRSALIEGA